MDTDYNDMVFKMEVGDVEYTDKKEAAKAFEEAVLAIILPLKSARSRALS